MESSHRFRLGELLTYPEWDITITQREDGLLISQHGCTYLARKWQLTPEVRGVIQTALSFGLTHLWQEGHPSKDESHHISFSFSHHRESWVFVIGGEARPPNLKFATFSLRFRGYFKDAGFEWAWEWENSGGKNILIQPRDLQTILKHLPLDEIREGRLPIYDRGRVLDRHQSFVRNETELEDILYATFKTHPDVHSLHRQRSFPANLADQRAARTDLIFVFDDRVVIAELKVGNSSEADVAQVRRYLDNLAVRSAYSGKPLVGVLIASNFQTDALAEAERSSITLYVFEEKETTYLRLICGDDVLPAMGSHTGINGVSKHAKSFGNKEVCQPSG